MKEIASESKEIFEPVEITLRAPDPAMKKRYMIGFGEYQSNGRPTDYTKEQLYAYGFAIYRVLTNAKLGPFWQVGAHKDWGPQLFEVCRHDVDESTLKKLIPEIHKEALKYSEGVYGHRETIGDLLR